MTLDQLKIGEAGVITLVGGEGALRRRLLDMGLTPRTNIFVRKMAPMGDPIEIRLRGYELTLRKEDASKIEVEGRTPHQDHAHSSHVHRHIHGFHPGRKGE